MYLGYLSVKITATTTIQVHINENLKKIMVAVSSVNPMLIASKKYNTKITLIAPNIKPNNNYYPSYLIDAAE